MGLPGGSRWLPFALFGALLAGLIVALAVAGWAATWSYLRLPTLTPIFADLRVIQAGYLSFLQGFDPQVSNPNDAWGRPMNYPSVWLIFAGLTGLDAEGNFLMTGIAIICAYIGVCALLLREAPSMWLLVLLASGASLLAVERCNIDLVIFVLLYAAAYFHRILGGPLLAVATLLKIFPVLAAPALLRDWRSWLLFMPMLGLVAWLLMPEVAAVRGATPTSGYLSYGAASVAALLEDHEIYVARQKIVGLYVVVLFGASLSAYVLHAHIIRWLEPPSTAGFAARLFAVGACVYLGSSVLSSNWDYRLIFLLLCTPWILGFRQWWIRGSVLVLTALAMNQPLVHALAGQLGFDSGGIYLNVGAKFLLFSVYALLLGVIFREFLSAIFSAAPRVRAVKVVR